MRNVPQRLRSVYARVSTKAGVGATERAHYEKWLRYYLDFCAKYRHPPRDEDSLQPFLQKLAEKHQGRDRQQQAAQAVRLYYGIVKDPVLMAELQPVLPPHAKEWDRVYAEIKSAVKTRGYSSRTLATYSGWISRFQYYLKGKPPSAVEMSDVKAYLSYLATERQVAASTQNQAFHALLFLFRHVFRKEFDAQSGVVRAKRRRYIPVVCTREEIERICEQLERPVRLVAQVLYACGLRLFECLNLRIHCFNFDEAVLTVHDGKGKKDRTVPLPALLISDLHDQVQRVRALLGQDLKAGFDGVFLPGAYARKAPSAAKELPWQWFFPAKTLTLVPESGEYRRYHLHETHVQKALRSAVRRAGLTKQVTSHTFRHSFASHLLHANYDIRTIQEMLGHSDVRTTMIYTHTVKSKTVKEQRSPMDLKL